MKRIVWMILPFFFFTLALGSQQSEVTYGFKMIKPRASSDLTFDDVFINVRFDISSSRLFFTLKNKSRSPIEVEWTRASFVDTDSEAHRVIHEGVRYVDRNNEMPSTIIPPQASISDLIHPTDYISYDSKSIEWKTSDLFSGRMSRYEGKTFSVFLPIKIGKVTKSYTFIFIVQKEKLLPRPAMKTNVLDLTSSQLKRQKITKQNLSDWPLTIDEAVLACFDNRGSTSVFLIVGEKVFALNGYALDARIDKHPVNPNVAEILLPEKKLGALIDFGLKLCQ